MPRTLTLYIAMSLDGYIAGPNDEISFLDSMDVEGEDYGYQDFLKDIDTVIWGRRTFDIVLGLDAMYLHRDKNVYVISRSRTGTHEHVKYHNDVVALVKELKGQEGKGIYCDGGGQIVAELLKARLVDKFVISVIPHLLGSGIRLFHDHLPEQEITFTGSKSYSSGLVQLRYERK